MISVIIPVYNVEQYICNTLASLIEQDEKDFELLLVDDGSKDESVSAKSAAAAWTAFVVACFMPLIISYSGGLFLRSFAPCAALLDLI